MAAPQTIWARGIRPGEHGMHDASCRCRGHCRSCYDDMAACRASYARIRAAGIETLDRPRRWFCTASCRREWWQPPRLRRRLRTRAFRRMRDL
jgi:hypothetical protein